MKILLVDPPGKNKGLNTGLGYLSAVLKESHKVSILDLNNIRIGLCGHPNPEISIKELENGWPRVHSLKYGNGNTKTGTYHAPRGIG